MLPARTEDRSVGNRRGSGMKTPPLSPCVGKIGAAPSAAGYSGVHGGVAGQDRPAADWICVAAARDILIVDDNDRHLDILSAILTSVGHDVETCGSGAEALRRLDSRHFDLVVLDLVMPEVSGIAVAQHMRDLRLNRDTPIIICTANMTVARRQLADIQGIVETISKPIDTASLILAVARAPIRQFARGEDDEQPKM
jgi:CheY-like chemotaxis protein